MKRLHNWDPDVKFDDFVDVGDHVDWELFNYFHTNLMTVKYDGYYLQVGHGYGFVNGRQTFLTFSKDIYTKNWVYRGHCHLGELQHLAN